MKSARAARVLSTKIATERMKNKEMSAKKVDIFSLKSKIII